MPTHNHQANADSREIRTLIVDDSPEARRALMAYTQTCTNLHLVGVAGNGVEAVSLATQQEPDLVLMDLNLPDLNGVEAGIQILTALPETRILIVSVHGDRHWQAIQHRAEFAGFINKQRLGRDLPSYLERIFPGRALAPNTQATR